MRIHVTKMFAEKLLKAGRLIEDNPAESSSVLDSWHANITTIQRRQCVVFVHDKAQYTLSARLCDRPCRVKGMKEVECLWPRKEMQALLERIA